MGLSRQEWLILSSMSNFRYKNYEVELKYNPKLKNTYIAIDPPQKVVVKSANNSYSYIINLLKSRDAWIEKQFQKQKNCISLDMNIEDEILLFGQKYSIDSEEALFLREKLHALQAPSKQKILKCYNDFYKILAKDYLQERAICFAQVMGLSFETIKYRKMKSRWGSCSNTRTITFNTELMKVDKEMIDYVVVHELAHLKYMNHSKAFHTLVESYLPNSKQIRIRLKQVQLR